MIELMNVIFFICFGIIIGANHVAGHETALGIITLIMIIEIAILFGYRVGEYSVKYQEYKNAKSKRP